MTDEVTLYHSPQTRSSAALMLLEELGAPYRLHLLNMKAGEQRQAAYLAVNPMGKVPAVAHRGVVVTEQVAIMMYLADAFAGAGLAPALDEAARGTYLRFLAFYGSCFEPAVIDLSLKREAAPQAMSPYGDFDTVLGVVRAQLGAGPYILGERFSAADVLWGTALAWMTGFGLVPREAEIMAYVGRVTGRPAYGKVQALDAGWAAEHAAAVAG